MLLQLSYESRGCTSIATVINGNAVLARTLDWDLPELRDLTIELDVRHGTTPLYTATTFAGYVGILTAMRPGNIQLFLLHIPLMSLPIEQPTTNPVICQ
jgi:hypothetical protein